MAEQNAPLVAKADRLVRSGRSAEALTLLENAIGNTELPPDAIRLYSRCLAQHGQLNAALSEQKKLVPDDITSADRQGRDDALAAANLAQLAMYYDDAAQIAQLLVERDPQDIEAASLLATLNLWLEGPDSAARVIDTVMHRDDIPSHLLAEALAYYREPPDNLVARVEANADNQALPAQTRSDLMLALAQHYDRVEAFTKAWQFAESGNALAPARQKQDWRGLMNIHRQIYQNGKAVREAGGSRHCYLLGTARSGQSLFQSILAAAPGVASIGERGALLQHVLFRTGDIARMPSNQRSAFYQQLHDSDHRGLVALVGEPELVVDKSPLHFPIAGSLALIHPSAAFAAVLRDPADIAMSIWIRSFPPIYDFATDFAATLDHIDFALDCIGIWRDAGIDIRLFDHADLVQNPARQSEALFNWLSLDWSDAYLDPENRTEPVPTFSATQVRGPISANTARSASPYARQLAGHASKIEELRDKKTALLEQS